ncbi:MAG: hypothetical protein ABI867_12180 [Kofleriaceae bacterium]
MTWSIAYADGAANAYRIWQAGDGDAQFEYIPVTPERSSTGHYSGGPPRAGTLTAAQVTELWRQLAELEREPRADERCKGDGAFRIDDRSFLVARGPLLLAFDGWLAKLA